jgi:hypothetical protein
MRSLTSKEVQAEMIKTLGFDMDLYNIESIEVIASALRRAAGLLCPCSKQTLIRAVISPLEHSYESMNEEQLTELKELVKHTLDKIITFGDILGDLEASDADGTSGYYRQLYAAAPSFFKRPSGSIILLGIGPDNISPFPLDIKNKIKPLRYLRILDQPPEGDDVDRKLREFGVIKLSEKTWLKKPKKLTALQLLQSIDKELDIAPLSGFIDNLEILDPDTSVNYYKGRWTGLKPIHTGRFIGRRPQAYGALVWCFVEVFCGRTVKFIDFPLEKIFGRTGYDQAWWLQMAIDHENDTPQYLEIRKNTNEHKVMAFFSPVPSWAERRLEAFGEKIEERNCLFSYKLPGKELEAELKFFEGYLWIKEKEQRSGEL